MIYARLKTCTYDYISNVLMGKTDKRNGRLNMHTTQEQMDTIRKIMLLQKDLHLESTFRIEINSISPVHMSATSQL